MLDLSTMLRNLDAVYRRQLKHLPALVGTGGHLLQRGPTGSTILDGIAVGSGPAEPPLAAYGPRGLAARRSFCHCWCGDYVCEASASRRCWGLTAGAAVFPQLVLEGVHSCLEVEEEARQRLHQGQHGCFTLHVGSMDIFWGGRPRISCKPLCTVLICFARGND